MKKFLFIALSLMLFGLTSCLDNVKTDYSPEVYTSFIVKNGHDTLGMTYDGETKLSSLDTTLVGDTLRFYVAFDALGNSLTGAKIIWDTTYINLTISFDGSDQTVLSAIKDTAQAKLGNFMFEPNYIRAVAIPVRCIMQKAGNPSLTFTVESDSQFSPVTRLFYCPIADRE